MFTRFRPSGSYLETSKRLAPASIFLALACAPLSAQFVPYSTHDWVPSVAGTEFPWHDTWADVKTPGGFIVDDDSNRFIYSVGTATTNNTTLGFSGQPAGTPLQMGFVLPPPGFRQVGIVQAVEDDSPGGARTIAWQQFFYGTTVGDPDRATNTRGISVWRTAEPADSRVAICGETYDQVLPLSQPPAGWPAATDAAPSGFIAVYDGLGTLLWSHHFFGVDASQSCVVTDLSIRVVDGADVVTYCGMSTHGNLAAGELSPLEPFLAPGAGCNGGGWPSPPGQWDGFVGRVVSPAGGPSARVFHSLVGGAGQDGLFGLAEIDENRFAVVGSSTTGAGVGGFPWGPPDCMLAGPYSLGSLLVFDATAVGPGVPLGFVSGAPLGTAGADFHSIARDVCFAPGVQVPADGSLYVVGSTDDDDFMAGTGVAIPGTPFAGPTDGFLIQAPVGGAPISGTFRGTEGNTGLTGVNCWNEFGQHVAVTGFARDAEMSLDIDVATYFYNDAYGGTAPPANTAPGNGTLQLLEIRDDQFGGDAVDIPAAMGATNVQTDGTPFLTFGLGQESGGGVAVGPTGRINVVGRSDELSDYDTVLGRAPDQDWDAVRTEVDMVPETVGPGVGRTDGTGFQPAMAYPTAGAFGGTTPFCALAEFGLQIGMPEPELRRILIDIEGDATAGSSNNAILVTRPTLDPVGGAPSTISVAALELGMPVNWATIAGVEYWLGDPGSGNPYVTILDFPSGTQMYRLRLDTLPAGVTLSAQVGSLLVNPIGGGGGCSATSSASPAIFIGL